MPRNDQIIRQWHLLRKLEGSNGVTLQELVSNLPDDFPKNPRTIRRDLEALEVDPYRLWYAAGGLYLIAYDHLRREVRMFAVERIHSITLTDHPYQMPLGFNVEDYVQDALMVMRGRRIEVELLFSKPAAAWVKDKIWHSSQIIIPLKDGRLRIILQVADTNELVGWILSFGSQVRAVRPDGLRQKVKEEARKIFRS